MSYSRFVLVMYLVFTGTLVNAQEYRDSLSFNWEKTPFITVIKAIESQTNYFFYYKNGDVDTVRVTLHATDLSIAALLDQIIENTELHYTIDQAQNIFITRSVVIDTMLTGGLFKDEGMQALPTAVQEDIRITARENTRGSKVYEIGNKANFKPDTPVTLSGVVRSPEGRFVAEASIQIEKLKVGTITNSNGYYSITLPAGRHELLIRFIGMKTMQQSIILYGQGTFDIEMQEEVKNLNEVVIEAEATSNVESVPLGVEKLNISEIKYVPVVFGEADVLRAVLTLPGVKSVGEASTGFNVRGGAPDQNLILFNDATIYNPSHFFGFFSSFNPETINTVELFKSTIPAKYGGRLSSVLQVVGKEGDSEKIKGSAGIGLVTCRFNIEGPITKGRTTFVAGGRTTYSNWLFNLLPEDSGYKNTNASFYDVNLSVAHTFNKENSLSVTGYLSHDESNLNTDTVFRYNNRNLSVKWQHDFNHNLSSSFAIGMDHYDYDNQYDTDTLTAYTLDFALDQQVLNVDFTYTPNARHVFDFGLHSTYYHINPGKFSKGHSASIIMPVTVEQEQALETALYLEDQYNVSPKLSFNAGLRYSLFNYLGPQDVRIYEPLLPRTETNAIDTVAYGKGDVISTYQGLDFRLSGRYSITKDFSIKAGFTTTRQFIHMITNTVAISPTDIWKLSDPNIKPQYCQQLSLGLYKNFFSNQLEVFVEGYTKRIENYLDYKSGAQFLANDHIETEVFATRGQAYGIETMIRKPRGNFNGWMSYTYSRTLLKTNDPQAGEEINEGKYYPANYDKPHDFTFFGNQKLSRRFSISMNITYSTGRPVTIPIGVFYYGGQQKTLYADRNSYRIPDYFRTDISINIEGNHKIKQLTHNSWTFGVYNLTGRKNPYSIYFTSVNGVVQGYKLSIFGSAIPFINYNIRF